MEDTYNKIAFRYAKALFLQSEEKGVLDQVLNDLQIIYDVLSREKTLFDVIKNRLITSEKKAIILEQIFKSKISDQSLKFIIFLTKKKRLGHIADCFICYREMYFDKNNILQAKIASAKPIEEKQKQTLIQTLEKKFNKKIIAHFKENEEQIAGFRVNIKDHVFDFSARAKLRQFKENMLLA